MVYLKSCNRFSLFTHGYLCILILECPLLHAACINIQSEGSPGLCARRSESVSVAGTSANSGRRKNKQALPTGEVICNSSHYCWLNLFT